MGSSPKNQKKKSSDSKSFLLLLLLMLGAGTFYFLGSSHKIIKAKKVISAYSPEADALVNQHLVVTSRSLELQAKRRHVENQFSAPQLGESVLVDRLKDKKDYGVDHSSDTNESNAYDDLNRYRQDVRLTDPDTIITNQLHDEDRAMAYDESYREEYARQFIENARRNGYEVRLDENYVVTSVKKIRTPSSSILGPQAQ